MKDILAAASIIVLEQYGLSKVVVGFGFDGTLAAIVDDRRTSAMRRSTREALWSVAKLYPCAVISGRARKDVQARLDGIDLRAVVGSEEMPPGDSDKGRVLLDLVAREGAHAAIYVGDDATDEAAFALRSPPVLGIRVGKNPASAARYFVRDQGRVDGLLARLVAIRAGGRYRDR
ncbi:MAG: hypothetical protein HOV80_02210 [Polyangiaceae bacterium]|nr:hypothetical protein [Polyangiaceae bacterium]